MQFRYSNRAAPPPGPLPRGAPPPRRPPPAPPTPGSKGGHPGSPGCARETPRNPKAKREPGNEKGGKGGNPKPKKGGRPGGGGGTPPRGPQPDTIGRENEKKGPPTNFLLGNTRYYVRIVLTNGLKETFSAPPNPTLITVAVDPPKVLAVNSASEIGYTVAKLSGSVERPANTNSAFDAHCSFSYVNHSQFIVSGFKNALSKPCATTPITTPGTNPVSANLTALKPGTVYHYRLNAVNAGGLSTMLAPATFTTTAITPPAVSVSNPVLGVGTAAHFSGAINPEKGPAEAALYDVTWRFECTPKCLNSEGKALSGPAIAADNSLHAVSADAVLEPNTEYRVRLVASNAGESASAGPVFVTTPASPAIAQTLGVSVTDDSATLGAKINPLNSPVSYQFEWGLSTAYEHKAPLAPEQLPRADNAYHFVGTALTGLAPATTYHYRIVATNTQLAEQTIGADRTFTTRAVPGTPASCPNDSSRVGLSANLPDCRAYEFVTPGLGGAGPPAGLSGLAVNGVRADGGAIAFIAANAPTDSEGATATTNTVLAARGAEGWSTKGLSAPTPLGSGAYFGEDRSTVGLSPTSPSRCSGATSRWPAPPPRRHQPLPAPRRRHHGRADQSRRPEILRRRRTERRLAGLQPPLRRLDRQTAARRPGQRGQYLRMGQRQPEAAHLPARRDAGAQRRLPARRRPLGGLRRRRPGPLQGGRPAGSLPAPGRPGNQESLRLGARRPRRHDPGGVGRHRRRRLAGALHKPLRADRKRQHRRHLGRAQPPGRRPLLLRRRDRQTHRPHR